MPVKCDERRRGVTNDGIGRSGNLAEASLQSGPELPANADFRAPPEDHFEIARQRMSFDIRSVSTP